MTTLKIAFRNVFRNGRRSLMTLSTVTVGALATLMLGALMSYMVLDYQTSTVRRTGHLTVFKAGYFDFGTANPAAYGIENYRAIQKLITEDPVLKPLIAVATPMQSVFGIAGNYGANVSKTFFGQGIIPSDRALMRRWNDYGFDAYDRRDVPFPDDDIEIGVVGVGLARILGLCDPLHLPNCPKMAKKAPAALASLPAEDFSRLGMEERAAAAAARPAADFPRIDLLAATAGGAPNVVSLTVHHAEFQGVKDIDDNFVVMNLQLAQRLLYGRGEHKVTGIVLQLHHTSDIGAARARLLTLFRAHDLDLEFRDFGELTPLYDQIIGFFAFLFTFIAVIIGVIVLFTIVNTMTMSVMERTSEIGTVRALGVQRGEVRGQFVAEGAILGIAGATLGIGLAALVVLMVNHAGVMWTPPMAAGKIGLRLYLFGNPVLVGGTWAALAGLATGAALMPASRAARMAVVDALRHV